MFREALAPLVPLLLGALRAQGAWGVAYPPADATAPRPAIVYLHGMWSTPEEQCALLERTATSFGFLVCPRGNAPFGDGHMWKGTYASVAPRLHAAIDAAAAMGPGKLDASGGGTLVGYSNGAYFAAEVARSEPGKWTGLVLLSMKLELDGGLLRRAGVRRVVMAAGDRDPVRDGMKALAEKLDATGLAARFVSLGPGEHPLPPDLDARLCEPLAWAREADAAVCRTH
jgi:acetyl esterase/lipase